MNTTQSARRTALAIGIAGASLIYIAGGPAVAGHGYMMKEHPLRGDFPLASGEPAPAASPHGNAADATARAPGSRAVKRGDWLRGDFPLAGVTTAPRLPAKATTAAAGADTAIVDQERANDAAFLRRAAGAARAERPGSEIDGYPITLHQLQSVQSSRVRESSPTPTLTMGGMPASPHQVAVLTPRVTVRVADRRRVDRRGDWLRGDFPRAAASRPAPVLATKGADGNVRVYTEAASQIPGFSKLRLEEVRLEPGAALDVGKTTTAFICEMAQGELEAVIDGAAVTRGIGDIWTCPMAQVSALHTNTGTTPAMMRVFHLIAE